MTSNIYKSFKESKIITTTQQMLLGLDYEINKLILKNNYSDNEVFMTIKFINGEYNQKEEDIFLEIFNNK